MKPNDVPCRVSADLRRHQREHPGAFPPNEQRIQQAREEIVEAILKGQGWRGHVVSAVLEDYLNVTPPELYDRLGEIGARLKLLASYDDATLPLLRESTKTWLHDHRNLPALVESTRAQFVAVRSTSRSTSTARPASRCRSCKATTTCARRRAQQPRLAQGGDHQRRGDRREPEPGREARLPGAAEEGRVPRHQLHGPARHRAVRRRDPLGPGGDRAREGHLRAAGHRQGAEARLPALRRARKHHRRVRRREDPDGDYLTHSMPISKVYDIRDRSEAWKAYKKDKSKTCPWVTDEEEMIKKTCVKQASKYWPKSPRLDAAIHHMNTDGGEGITLHPNKMPEAEYLDWKAQIEKCTTKDAAKARVEAGARRLRGPRRRHHRREAEGRPREARRVHRQRQEARTVAA
jgi:hypothetical protein